jgi:hypothetical protein
MKIFGVLTALAVTFMGQAVLAKTINTRTTDTNGTSFLISIDWDARVVTARLFMTPSSNSEASQLDALQSAVYYSSAAGCYMRNRQMKISQGRKEITGALECPWFER